ncbi:MAG: hypothetical protein JWL97_3451 [Gemmatimonadales bacterium]|nr:hypothetical protein [Gemmatimonadales bacterium]
MGDVDARAPGAVVWSGSPAAVIPSPGSSRRGGGRGHGAFHVWSGGVNQTRVPPPAPVGNLTCGDLAPVHGRNVSCRTRDWGGGVVEGSDMAVAHAVEDQGGQFTGGGGLGDVTGFGAAAGQDAVLDRADR